MSKIAWLHISDLHFRVSKTYDSSVVLQALLVDVAKCIEQDGLNPDFVVITGLASGIYCWRPQTMQVIHSVQEWSHQGLEDYFTIDAGLNVYLLCRSEDQTSVEQELGKILADL